MSSPNAADATAPAAVPADPPPVALRPWQEWDWKALLDFIVAGRVIPILGPGLLLGQDTASGRTVSVSRYLAARLCPLVGLTPAPGTDEHTPGAPTLADLACRALEERIGTDDFYSQTTFLLAQATLQPPPVLLELAAITDFPLLITTGFDGLLVRAVELARGRPLPPERTLAYCPKRVEDLPGALPAGDAADPFVYHLLGRASNAAEFVVSEEDLLEWLHHLQSSSYQPRNLFNELGTHHLLFLGGGFDDWLARFLLRTVKGNPLSHPRQSKELREFIVDGAVSRETRLARFLCNYSKPTRFYPRASPLAAAGPASPPVAVTATAVDGPEAHVISFVLELARRWREHPKTLARPKPVPGIGPDPRVASGSRTGAGDSAAAPRGAVFLSYSSKGGPDGQGDRAAVARLRNDLLAAGLPVWFDQGGGIESGAAWRRTIQVAIENCALFVPLITQHTESRPEAFFRQEWRWAESREGMIDGDHAFILPVALEGHDLVQKTAKVPPCFREKHWTILPVEGRATPEFIAKLRALLNPPADR